MFFAVDSGAGDAEQFGEFGLGEAVAIHELVQVCPLGAAELGLLALELALARAAAMPSLVRIRIRSVSNSATMPRTLNSSFPTGSFGL